MVAKGNSALKPWIICGNRKGKKWSKELNDALEESKVGIICLNRNNLSEPWILFEAGAIAKTKDSRACHFFAPIRTTRCSETIGRI